MMRKTIWSRWIASALTLTIVGTASVYGAKKARAQGMRIGSVVARADHSEVDVNGKSILLTGGVTVDTADGQSVASDTIRLVMGPNPVTKKDDVASAVAEGHVRFKTIQNTAQPKAPPQIRTIQGSSDKGVWNRFDGKAELTGHVTVSLDDPARKMIWRDAGSATVDLKAGKVMADRAKDGPQMTIEAISKEPLASKKTTK